MRTGSIALAFVFSITAASTALANEVEVTYHTVSPYEYWNVELDRGNEIRIKYTLKEDNVNKSLGSWGSFGTSSKSMFGTPPGALEGVQAR